jgi:hypothetical protein
LSGHPVAIPRYRQQSGRHEQGGFGKSGIIAPSTFRKAAVFGQCGRIAGTMQDPNDHKLMLIMQVVDGIVARKTNAQPAREVFSRRGCKWKVKQPVAILLDLVDEARRCCL